MSVPGMRGPRPADLASLDPRGPRREVSARQRQAVMAGLVPAIHVFVA
jgi:hypothetical protein